jgi:hypothetical protein
MHRLLKYSTRFKEQREEESDKIRVRTTRDLAGETTYSDYFPLRISPLPLEDLQYRLPLRSPCYQHIKNRLTLREDGVPTRPHQQVTTETKRPEGCRLVSLDQKLLCFVVMVIYHPP